MPSKQTIFWGFIFCLITMLSGCTSLSLPTGNAPCKKEPYAKRYKALQHIHRFDITGSFSLRQPNRSIIAAYDWQQRHQETRLRIHSSLDLYGVVITYSPHRTQLSSGKQMYTASSPEQLMRQQLGWHLPISNLLYWLRGMPAPAPYRAKYDACEHLIELQQQGFLIRFSHYTTLGAFDLPQSLELFSNNLTLKIVIKQWKL